MSIKEQAHELAQIQKELLPLIDDLRAILEQETDEIPIYKIEHIIPFMMVRYCNLRNQEIAIKRRIEMLFIMQKAERRYKEMEEERKEEEEERKEEKLADKFNKTSTIKRILIHNLNQLLLSIRKEEGSNKDVDKEEREMVLGAINCMLRDLTNDITKMLPIFLELMQQEKLIKEEKKEKEKDKEEEEEESETIKIVLVDEEEEEKKEEKEQKKIIPII